MTHYIETLREKLEEATSGLITFTKDGAIVTNEFLQGVTNTVMLNAGTVKEQYQKTGLEISNTLLEPWAKAVAAITEFNGEPLTLMNSWTQSGGAFSNFQTNATTQLTSPWTAGTTALQSFSGSVSTEMGKVVQSVESNVSSVASQLSSLYTKIQDTENRAQDAASNISSTLTSANNNIDNAKKNVTATATVQANGKTFSQTAAVTGTSDVNKAKEKALSALQSAVISYMSNSHMSTDQAVSMWDKTWGKKVTYSNVKAYAKGTLGTKNDEFAITDESWIGEEITLAAGKNGQLQYLKKGSAVMPADISANLVEWGKLNPSMLNIANPTSGITMISNAVNKPELKLDVENFLKVDRVDKDTLPELEKMMDKKIDVFAKQLNYSLKRFK